MSGAANQTFTEPLVVVPMSVLQAMLDKTMAEVVKRELASAGERIGIDGMAARFGVNRRTICNWLKQPGKLPPRRAGQKWLLSDVLDWEKHMQVPKFAQRIA